MDETIFSRIIQRQLPATIVYEDEEIIGFKDCAPVAPVHVLFVPKTVMLATLDDARAEHAPLLGRLLLAAAQYAREKGLAQEGYRIAINCNAHAGQTVFHLHFHLLAGAPLGGFATTTAAPS